MRQESHLKALKESLEVIEESIEKGIEQRQRTIGFSASAACVDMLSLFLHKKSLIDPGFIIKHEWFNSPNTLAEKFPFEFPQKKMIFKCIISIEEKRNLLCYGKPQQKETIEKIIENIHTLKKLFKEEGLDEF